MRRRLIRWPKYVKSFGALAGTRLAWGVERDLPRHSTKVRAFDVPGWSHPVWLRDSLPDHATFWQCLVASQYDIERFPHTLRLEEVYRTAIASGRLPVVIDCGANIGLATLWFARRFPEAKVVAVEPDPANLEVLRRNTEFLGNRVVVVAGGVWSQSGWLRIVNPDSGAAAFRVEPCTESTPGALRAFSIDELRAAGGGGELLVVKIDIEGAQTALFANNTDWVADVHLLTLELDDWQFPWVGSSRSFFACLSKLPFEYLLGGESVFCFRDGTTKN